MKLLVVGLGGFLGSVSRYCAGKAIVHVWKPVHPLPTFLVNIIGAFLLGVVNGSMDASGSIYLFMADGFLGAFTTFSTFMYEGFSLIKGRKHLNAAIYIASSLVFGVIFYIIGTTVKIV